MIYVDSGKLTIPEDERFIGFAGDNSVVEKRILVLHRPVQGSVYTLCLRFDSGAVRSVPLASEIINSDTVLTWTVDREDILEKGIVSAQIKIKDGNIVRHTTKDFFLAGWPVELDDEGVEIEHITPSQLESSIAQAVSALEAKAPYLGEDGFWYVYERSAEQFIKTGYRGNLQLDSVMSESGVNPVANSTVTAYINGQIASVRDEIGDIESALAAI